MRPCAGLRPLGLRGRRQPCAGDRGQAARGDDALRWTLAGGAAEAVRPLGGAGNSEMTSCGPAGRRDRSARPVPPARRPTVTTPNDSWLPSSDEPLFILAMDQRASFAKDVFGVSGPPSSADVARMREAKALIYEGLRHVAGSVPFGREGVLVDEDLGADVARTAKSDGVVLLMPIERSGSRVFELEFGDHFVEHVEAFDPDFFKVLVRFNPLDDEADATDPGRPVWLRCPNGRTARGDAGSSSSSSLPPPSSWPPTGIGLGSISRHAGTHRGGGLAAPGGRGASHDLEVGGTTRHRRVPTWCWPRWQPIPAIRPCASCWAGMPPRTG